MGTPTSLILMGQREKLLLKNTGNPVDKEVARLRQGSLLVKPINGSMEDVPDSTQSDM